VWFKLNYTALTFTEQDTYEMLVGYNNNIIIIFILLLLSNSKQMTVPFTGTTLSMQDNSQVIKRCSGGLSLV